MRIKRGTLAVCALSMLSILTGCIFPTDPRTSNQGGGNILTATGKIASGQLSSLTPDEIQILADTAAQANPQIPDIQLTDEQAQAASDFLKANNVNTVEDVQNLIEQAQQDPNSIVIPDSVTALFDAGAFDTGTGGN